MDTATSRKQQFSLRMGSNSDTVIAIALISGMVLVRLWAVSRWPATFDGDEAIFGLMAKHILLGERPIFFYGQDYLGTFDAFLEAIMLRTFGADPFWLRIPSVVQFALFAVLHFLVVRRSLGIGIALASLAFMAIPSPLNLELTSSPQFTFGAVAIPGTFLLYLLLGASNGEIGSQRYTRAIFVGVLAGFTLWIKPTGLIYFLAAFIVWMLGSPGWANTRRSIAAFVPAGKVVASWPIVTLLFAFSLVVVAAFTGDCGGAPIFQTLQRMAAIGLVGLGGVLMVSYVVRSKNSRRTLVNASLVVLGTALGGAPLWVAFTRSGVFAQQAIQGSCPTEIGERILLVWTRVLPSLIGFRGFESIPLPFDLDSFLARVLIVLFVGLIASFFVMTRHSWAQLAMLKTLSPVDKPICAFGCLFTLNVGLGILAGNIGQDVGARHLLIAWQAAGVLVAIALARTVGGFRIARALLLVAWLIIGAIGFQPVQRTWTDRWDLASVRQLEQYLSSHNATNGYADYWTAYPLTFLSNERLILTPLNGTDRYSPYTTAAAAAQTKAYVFDQGLLPKGDYGLPDMLRALCVAQAPAGPPNDDFVATVANHTLVARAAVARWDVWVVRMSTPTSGTSCGGREITLSSARFGTATAAPGDTIPVTIDMVATAPLRTPYIVSARLRDRRGQIISEANAPIVPLDRKLRVESGQAIVAEIALPIPPTSRPGAYDVDIVFFDHRWQTVHPGTDQARKLRVDSIGTIVVASTAELPLDGFVPVRPSNLRFGRYFAFLGTDRLDVRPEAITVSLYLRAVREVDRDFSIFTQLLDASGKLVAQRDSFPWDGDYPTSAWTPLRTVRNIIQISLPTNLSSGRYRVIAGLYLLRDLSRLPVLDANGREIGDFVELGEVLRP